MTPPGRGQHAAMALPRQGSRRRGQTEHDPSRRLTRLLSAAQSCHGRGTSCMSLSSDRRWVLSVLRPGRCVLERSYVVILYSGGFGAEHAELIVFLMFAGFAAFMVIIVLLMKRDLDRNRLLLDKWAAEKGLVLVEVQVRLLPGRPFFLHAYCQLVRRIRARDKTGALRSGWVKTGSFWQGPATPRVEVWWDGDAASETHDLAGHVCSGPSNGAGRETDSGDSADSSRKGSDPDRTTADD